MAKKQSEKAKHSGNSAYCELEYGSVDIYSLADKKTTEIVLDSDGKDLPYIDLTVELFDGAYTKELPQANPIAKKLLRRDSDEETCLRYFHSDRRVATINDSKLWLHLENDLTVGVYNGKQLMSSCIAKIKRH